MRSLKTPIRPLIAVAATVVAVCAASCEADAPGGPDEPSERSESSFDPQLGVDPTAPVKEGELPEPGPIDLAELDDDARGLTLGEEHVVGDNHTTLLEVRRPLPSSAGAPRPPSGHEWAGARASTCFESDLDRQLEIGSYLFSAVGEDAFSYPGVQPKDVWWPLPQYPGYGRLAPGQCTSGWVAIPVPVGASLTAIVQSSVTREPVAEWSVPADAW